jgi:triacylglycerol lipase
MGRIKVCNFGRIMLKIFCWTTVILSIYLIIGFTGCYEKWFGGPAGIVKATGLSGQG